MMRNVHVDLVSLLTTVSSIRRLQFTSGCDYHIGREIKDSLVNMRVTVEKLLLG